MQPSERHDGFVPPADVDESSSKGSGHPLHRPSEFEKPPASPDPVSTWLSAQLDRSVAYHLGKGPLRPEATVLDYAVALGLWVAVLRLLSVDWKIVLVSAALFFGGHALYVRFVYKARP